MPFLLELKNPKIRPRKTRKARNKTKPQLGLMAHPLGEDVHFRFAVAFVRAFRVFRGRIFDFDFLDYFTPLAKTGGLVAQGWQTR